MTGSAPFSTHDPAALGRLRRLGEICLWLLVIGVVVVATVNLLDRLRLVVLPIGLALVLSTFLHPPARSLARRGLGDGAAAFAVVIAALLGGAGIGALLVPPTLDGIEELDVGLTGGLEEIQRWLATGPLPISEQQAAALVDRVQNTVTSNLDALAGRAVSGALLTLEVLAGLALSVVLLFFFLKDGGRMWSWIVGLAPPTRRHHLDELGRRSWHALGGFARGQSIVALFDAVFIGLALLLLGVPLVIPLAALTFVGAYVPILGAVVAGAAAALVGLVAGGFMTAVGVIAAVVVVQQLEGNVFQPVVVARAVQVHPVAVLVGVTAGGVLAGVIGALVAAPVVAIGNAILSYLREQVDEEPAGVEPARTAVARTHADAVSQRER